MDETNMLKINRFLFSDGMIPIIYDPIINNDIESIREYIQSNGILTLESIDRFGWTPVDYASYYGYNDSLRILLEFGGVSIINGWVLLYSLIGSNRNNETLKILLNAGADVNFALSDGTKSTPLHICARQGSVQCFRTLLEYGADVNALNHNGETPRDIINLYRYNKDMLDILDEYELTYIKEPEC